MKSVQFPIRISTVQLTWRNSEIAKSVKFAIRISAVQLILRNSEIAKSFKFAIRISPVQLTLQNCEISSVCYQNFSCSVDFAKLLNQFSLTSEFLLFS